MSVIALAPAPPPERLRTPQEVAERLSVSRSMIYMLIREGELVALKIGRLPRISEAAIEDYLRRAAARS